MGGKVGEKTSRGQASRKGRDAPPPPPEPMRIAKAMAHPSRLMMLEAMEGKERCVCELTELVGVDQSTVSKHLAVLREVGIVAVSKRGRERVYQLNGAELKPVHDWVKTFERFWTHHLDRIKERAERMAREKQKTRPPTNQQEKRP